MPGVARLRPDEKQRTQIGGRPAERRLLGELEPFFAERLANLDRRSQLRVVLPAISDGRNVEGIERVVLGVVIVQRRLLIWRQRLWKIRAVAGVLMGVHIPRARLEGGEETGMLQAEPPRTLSTHRMSPDENAL